MECPCDSSITLINLPWQDVLFKNILSTCNLKDLFNLRCTSKSHKVLVDFYLEKLTRLHLKSSIVKNSKTLQILATNCHSLKRLNVTKCKYLDLNEDIFISLLENNYKSLVEINLSHCKTISKQSMQFLIVNCNQLKTLIMIGCDWFKTGTLDSITCHQNKLEFVDFTRCILLSERSILKFIVKFLHLKYLSLAYIPTVTDRVLYTIVQHCPKLEHLNINRCDVTGDAVGNFIRWRKNVTITFSYI